MSESKNFGIKAIEIYFPKTYVSQAELDKNESLFIGEYNSGLESQKIALIDGNEDINSICLTVVKDLLEKYNIDPKTIGRLDLNVRSFMDKPETTKNLLMQLFSNYKNYDIEGITYANPSSSAMSAFINAINWVQNHSSERKNAIVIVGDTSVYLNSPVRYIGGIGAIAMLIGSDAMISLEEFGNMPIDNAANSLLTSEYQISSTSLNISAYLKALNICYAILREKLASKGEILNLNNIDFCCFDNVSKRQCYEAFKNLVANDLQTKPHNCEQNVENRHNSKSWSSNNRVDEKETQKNILCLTDTLWKKMHESAIQLGWELGNISTEALFIALFSLTIQKNIDLRNKQILMFGYGEGLQPSMFLLRTNSNIGHFAKTFDIRSRDSQKIIITPQEYYSIIAKKENFTNELPYQPLVFYLYYTIPFILINLMKPNNEKLHEGTYFLMSVDQKGQRVYRRKPKQMKQLLNEQLPFIPNKLANGQEAQNDRSQDYSSLQRLIQVKNNLTGENSISTGNNNVMQESSDADLIDNMKIDRKMIEENNLIWTGFHKKAFKERLDHLRKLDPDLSSGSFETGGLDLTVANLMIENCIGKISLPLGLGLNFLINGKFYMIPMAVEEPSIVAACSNAAKIISQYGGFIASSTSQIMRGQIQLLDCDPQAAKYVIEENKTFLIEEANTACTNMKNRGGGVVDIIVKIKPIEQDLKSNYVELSDMIIVELFIDVCESMGANVINTVLEHIAPYVETLTRGRVGLKILSNFCTERKSKAQFFIPVKKLEQLDKNISGDEMAKKLIEAYIFAKLDIYRACTHNKGILNGIDAVAIATGQDWRAIEAASHAYAAMNGKYQPLTKYEIIKNKKGEKIFVGTLEIPISVGSKGGVLENNQIYKNSFRILSYPNAKELAEIMICVGLAQNFAALRAMVTVGIQKGHMNLHAKNIAISTGVPVHLAADAAEFMISRRKINKDGAINYLEALHLYSEMRTNGKKSLIKVEKRPLSTFYVEIQYDPNHKPLLINIAFDCMIPRALHLSIEKNPHLHISPIEKEVHKLIIGEKGYEWLHEFLAALQGIKFGGTKWISSLRLFRLGNITWENMIDEELVQGKIEVVHKLKILGILVSLTTSNLANLKGERFKEIYPLIKNDIEHNNQEVLKKALMNETIPFKYGIFLLYELIKVFNYNLEQMIPIPNKLTQHLIDEIFFIIESAIVTFELWNQSANIIKSTSITTSPKKDDKNTTNLQLSPQNNIKDAFYNFLNYRRKRLSATMVLLCDALVIKQSDMNEIIINKIKQLGEIIEIEGTMIRDLSRWNQANQGDNNNLYTYYLRLTKKESKSKNQETINEYLNLVKEYVEKKKSILFAESDYIFKDVYLTAKEIIENNYLTNKVYKPNLQQMNTFCLFLMAWNHHVAT